MTQHGVGIKTEEVLQKLVALGFTELDKVNVAILVQLPGDKTLLMLSATSEIEEQIYPILAELAELRLVDQRKYAQGNLDFDSHVLVFNMREGYPLP